MGGIVRNCRLCKRAMETSPFMLCRICLVESDKVQSHIAKHPNTSIDQIAQATEVPFKKIREMVKLGLSKVDQ